MIKRLLAKIHELISRQEGRYECHEAACEGGFSLDVYGKVHYFAGYLHVYFIGLWIGDLRIRVSWGEDTLKLNMFHKGLYNWLFIHFLR